MPKRLLVNSPSEIYPSRALDLRMGLTPQVVTLTPPALILVNGANAGVAFALSPDQSGMLATVQLATAGANFRFLTDPANLLGAVTPAVTFSGVIYAAACSNAYYAVGGASPFLQVYNKSTHAVQSVSATGLGTVNDIDFSPDGTKMIVAHQTSPYIRVYNTSDWTYTDLNSGILPGVSPQAVRYTSDGSHFVTQSSASPYLCAYTSLTARSFSSTTAGYAAQAASGRGGSTLARSPISGTTVVFSSSAGTVGNLDTASTGTVTTYAAMTGINTPLGAVVTDPDTYEDAVYVNHGQGTAGRTWSKWKLSDRSAHPTQPDEFRNFIYGNGTTPYSAAAIIRTTPYNITGTVRDVNNSPAARVIRAFDRATGQLVAQTTSDGSTGNYLLQMYSAGPFDVQYMAASGELLNDIVYAKATPAAG